MNTALDLAPRPSPTAIPVEEELDLAALLQLFEPGEDEPASVRISLRSSATSLLRWAQGSSRRAASWGAVSAGWQ